MEKPAVHRIVEQHAAANGDAPAILCAGDVLTYRALNHRANAVARQLLSAGFRRGDHLAITMAPGADLATVLLAVLKSGGAYRWVGAGGRKSALVERPGDGHSSWVIDLGPILEQPIRPGPNLPVLTRPSDIACVLKEDGESLLVPHATITALPAASSAPIWDGDRTTFDLWTGLLSGMALTVESVPALLKAA